MTMEISRKQSRVFWGQSFTKFFFFKDTATTEIYTLSLHDALPISMYRNDDALRKRSRYAKNRNDAKASKKPDPPLEQEIGRAHV